MTPVRLIRTALLLLLILCAAGGPVEHYPGRRDAARLTANATFYTEGDRRVRYYLTSPQGRNGADASGPTVVLLNGMMASFEQWSTVQGALGATTPVLSYDRSGNGFSDLAHAHGAEADRISSSGDAMSMDESADAVD